MKKIATTVSFTADTGYERSGSSDGFPRDPLSLPVGLSFYFQNKASTPFLQAPSMVRGPGETGANVGTTREPYAVQVKPLLVVVWDYSSKVTSQGQEPEPGELLTPSQLLSPHPPILSVLTATWHLTGLSYEVKRLGISNMWEGKFRGEHSCALPLGMMRTHDSFLSPLLI